MERRGNGWRASIVVAAALVAMSEALAESAGADVQPPASSKELFEWLKAGSYKGWDHAGEPHPSQGSHPGGVLAYLNPALDGSLKSGGAAHPEGSAAVLELYGAGGKLHGWAVSIKTQRDSAGGQGWYWYEVFSTKDGKRTLAADQGAPACAECHAKGRDFVLAPDRLR